jgi:hypothetical protein
MAKETEQRQNEIRIKRISTLVGAYDFMCQRYREIRECTHLHKSLVASTVEDYLRDREALVNRHNITGRIQRHKIAGMMAAAIVKNRPIQLLADSPASGISMDNECLAVLHGLAICAEGKKIEEIKVILALPTFRGWFQDFIYLLHRQPSHTEGFIGIFHTLSATYFPENILHGGEKPDGVIKSAQSPIKPTMTISESSL